MMRILRLAGYLLVAAIVLAALAGKPQAWASPDSMYASQTVPTRTPKPPPTTPPPTAEPRPIDTPRPTEAPQPTLPAPTATRGSVTFTPTATTAARAAADLSLVAQPIQVWQGVTVVYTLTVVNRSATALRDVVLLVSLPGELQPGAVLVPEGAGWQGTILRVAVAELTTGAQVTAVFAAVVAADVPAGKVIATQASVEAAGMAPVSATALVAMPPAELPAVGRDAGPAR